MITVRLRQQNQHVAAFQPVNGLNPGRDQLDDGSLSLTVGDPPIALGKLTVEHQQRGAIFR
jgi:hypothetical protein